MKETSKIKLESYIWKNKKDLNSAEQVSIKMID